MIRGHGDKIFIACNAFMAPCDLSKQLKQEMFEVHLKLHISDGRAIAFCQEYSKVLSKTASIVD